MEASRTGSFTETLIEKLIVEQPRFHAWPDGRPANWAVAPDVLRFIFEQLKPGMNTLETGAGQTTIAFCVAGTHHIAITPDQAQAERIRAYVDKLGIDCDLTFIHGSSDLILPSGRGIPEHLDFVLIDGAHRFPFPIVDWHYTEQRIPVGGIVVVDDWRMPSVRILYDFLAGENDWELVKEFPVTSFFRRARKTENVWDWIDQNINEPHLERITKDVVIEEGPAEGPDLKGQARRPGTSNEQMLEIELRAAKLQLNNIAQELREKERNLRSTDNNLRKTRDELWQIKNSRSYRLYQRLRPALTAVQWASARLWPKKPDR